VKPANLLVDGSGRAWITDFGLAAFRTERGLTMTGDLVGTVRYMSPEQTRAKRAPVDHRTDIYSLGATLFEMLTLTQAFPGEDTHRVLADVVEVDPPGARRLNPAVPLELETIVLKAMAKRPDDRYETAQDLGEDLRRFLDDLPIRAKRPSLPKIAAKWARRHRTLVSAAAVVFLIAFAGLATGGALLAQEARRYESLYGRARDTLNLMLLEVTQGREARMAGLSEELLESLRSFHADFLFELEAGDPREVALAHGSLGRILTILGNDEEAERHLFAADAILEELVLTEPQGPSYRLDRIAVQQHLGELWLSRDDAERARGSFETAVRMAEKQVTLFPSVDARLARGRTWLAFGRFLVAEGRKREALLKCYRPARDDLAALLETEPGNVEVRELLALVYHRASDVLREEGETEKALGARWQSGRLYEELEFALPDDPQAEQWRNQKWDAEADCRAVTWDLFRKLPPRLPTPEDIAGIDAALDDLDPIPPADRPLTTLPDRFQAHAYAFLPWGDQPFVGFRLRGDASHGGRWAGTSRCIQAHTIKGRATVSITVLDFGDGTTIEAWGLGLPADNTDALTGTFILRNGRGRLAGAVGAGRMEAESLHLQTTETFLTYRGRRVRLGGRGTISRRKD
ncbi:MAG: serine/threonine protein kinase, partial [Planctomycetota bacterium]